MHRTATVSFTAVLTAALALATPAVAQLLSEAPALDRGGAVCSTKFPGSFLDIGTGACWECPSTHPNRTIFPVTQGWACERPAYEDFREADGPRNPTGLIRTDCQRGWFLDIGRGRCYRCPSGFNRSLHAVDHPRACSRVVPVARTEAVRKGTEGCPDGAFRNGLTGYCFSCPTGFVRNALIAADLTQINACTRISLAFASDAIKEKFDTEKGTHSESRDSLGYHARRMVSFNPGVRLFDLGSIATMKALVDGEMLYLNGFDAVSMLVSVGASVLLGYTHSFGYTMMKVSGAHQCRKTWSNTFTAGLAAGAGASITIVLQKGAAAGLSETNGWQTGVSFPPVSGGWGLHWDATTGALSSAYNFGPALELDITISEFAHSWTETGGLVDCEKLTWGHGWRAL